MHDMHEMKEEGSDTVSQKSERPTSPSLKTFGFELSKQHLQKYPQYYYEMETSDAFEAVLKELRDYYNTILHQVLIFKGESVYHMIYSRKSRGVSAALANVLHVIGSLAIWEIREGLMLTTPQLWSSLGSSEQITNKRMLDNRCRDGKQWARIVKDRKLGTIAVLHMIPSGFDIRYRQAMDILDTMSDISHRAETATTYVSALLQLYISSLRYSVEASEKRKLSIWSVREPNSKRQKSLRCTPPQEPSTIRDKHGQILPQVTSQGQVQESPRILYVIYASPQGKREEGELCTNDDDDGQFLYTVANHIQSITFPRDRQQDAQISFTVGAQTGRTLIQAFSLQPLTTNVRGVQQYSKIPRSKLLDLGSFFYRATIHSTESVLGPVSVFISDENDAKLSIMVDQTSGRKLRDMFRWKTLYVSNDILKKAKKWGFDVENWMSSCRR